MNVDSPPFVNRCSGKKRPGAGDAVNAVVLSQAGHFVFIDPESAVWPQVVQSTRVLLGLSH